MRVFINGEEAFVAGESLSIEESTSNFSTCSFTVRNFGQLVHYKKGQLVEVFSDYNTLEFVGEIFSSQESGIQTRDFLEHSITCRDLSAVTEGITAIKAYENRTVGYIARDLLNSYLVQEGITEGTIQEGPTLLQVGFSYISVLDALNAMAERSGFWWYIDQFRRFHFVSKESFKAPWDATWDTVLRGSVSVEHTNPTYRNTQYLLGCKGLTDELVEHKIGDETERNFTVSFPVGKKPTIEVSTDSVNFTQKTVGIKGVDSGFDFYWAYGDQVITHDSNQPALAATLIRITYVGLFDMVVKVQSNAEIERYKNISGGTGLVEKVDVASYNGLNPAMEGALQLLTQHAVEGLIVSYTTDKEGLTRGMLQTVNFPEHDIEDKQLLITSITASEDNGVFIYSVTAVVGPFDGDWTSFFRKQNKLGDRKIFEGQSFTTEPTVMPIYSFEKTWTQSDFPNLFGSSLYPGKTTYPSETIYPSFNPGNKVKYLAWYVGGVEAGRKKILVENIEKGSITSIGFLGTDVIGEISHIAWFGGEEASVRLGTGILLDKQTFVLSKTSLEICQIEKIDRKGW